jgi:CRP-like cAMP-binding protein
VFHEVERLDVVKMVRLLPPLDVNTTALTTSARPIAEVVSRPFMNRTVLPRIARIARAMPLFAGLSGEQIERLASICSVCSFEPGAMLFEAGGTDGRFYLLLEGEVKITTGDSTDAVGAVKSGECVGEISLLTDAPHSASAAAQTCVEAALLPRAELGRLIRLRPDIGLQIYKNLALGLGEKLKRASIR